MALIRYDPNFKLVLQSPPAESDTPEKLMADHKSKYIEYRRKQRINDDSQDNEVDHYRLNFILDTSETFAEFYYRFFRDESGRTRIRFDIPTPPCLINLLHYRSPSQEELIYRNPHPFLASPLKLKLDLPVSWIDDWSHIVVAGGIVHNAIIGDYHAYASSDVDIFFIAPTPTTHPELFDGYKDKDIMARRIRQILLDKLYALITSLRNFAAQSECSLMFVDNGRALTVNLFAKCLESHVSCGPLKTHGSRAFQFVYGSYYKNVYDLLDRFDLAPCKMAWNGQCVFASVDAMTYLTDFMVHIDYNTVKEAYRDTRAKYTLDRLSKYCGRTYVSRRFYNNHFDAMFTAWSNNYQRLAGIDWPGIHTFQFEAQKKLYESLVPSFSSEAISKKAFEWYSTLHEYQRKCIHSLGHECQCNLYPQTEYDIAELRSIRNDVRQKDDNPTFRAILGQLNQTTLEASPFTLLWWHIRRHASNTGYTDGNMTEATCGGYIGGYTFSPLLPHCIVFCDTWNHAVRVIHLPSRSVRTLYRNEAIIKAPLGIYWAADLSSFYVETSHRQYFMVNIHGDAIRTESTTVVEKDGSIRFLASDSGFMYGDFEGNALNLSIRAYVVPKVCSGISKGPQWLKTCPLGFNTRLTRTMDHGMIVTFDTNYVYTDLDVLVPNDKKVEDMVADDWSWSKSEALRLWPCTSKPSTSGHTEHSFIEWYAQMAVAYETNTRPGWDAPCDFSILGRQTIQSRNVKRQCLVKIPIHSRVLFARWKRASALQHFAEFTDKTLDISHFASCEDVQHIVDMMYDGRSDFDIDSSLFDNDDFLALEFDLFSLEPQM